MSTIVFNVYSNYITYQTLMKHYCYYLYMLSSIILVLWLIINKWKPQYLFKERITFKDHLWLEMNVYAYDFTTRFGIKTFGIELFRRQIYHYQVLRTQKLFFKVFVIKLYRHWLLIFFSSNRWFTVYLIHKFSLHS